MRRALAFARIWMASLLVGSEVPQQKIPAEPEEVTAAGPLSFSASAQGSVVESVPLLYLTFVDPRPADVAAGSHAPLCPLLTMPHSPQADRLSLFDL